MEFVAGQICGAGIENHHADVNELWRFCILTTRLVPGVGVEPLGGIDST